MRVRPWYVKATRPDQSWRLVSGPFYEMQPAFTECRRIAPFYPDAHLEVQQATTAKVVECTPRAAAPGDSPVPAFDLSTVGARRAASAALAEHVRHLGFDARVEDWEGEPDVDVWVPALRANIWLAHLKAAPIPIVSWHSAAFPLREVLPGAWGQGHGGGRKATSLPADWSALFEAVTMGLCAGVDGSAFDL